MRKSAQNGLEAGSNPALRIKERLTMRLIELAELARQTIQWHETTGMRVARTPVLGLGTARWIQAVILINQDPDLCVNLIKDGLIPGRDRTIPRDSEIKLIKEYL